MAIKIKQVDSEKLSQVIVDGMLEKKASDVLVMDLRGINGAFADFFILCNGNSETQIDAISESVEEFVERNPQIKKYGIGRGKKIRNGFCWILSMLLRMFLKRRQEHFIIWSNCGEMLR